MRILIVAFCIGVVALAGLISTATAQNTGYLVSGSSLYEFSTLDGTTSLINASLPFGDTNSLATDGDNGMLYYTPHSGTSIGYYDLNNGTTGLLTGSISSFVTGLNSNSLRGAGWYAGDYYFMDTQTTDDLYRVQIDQAGSAITGASKVADISGGANRFTMGDIAISGDSGLMYVSFHNGTGNRIAQVNLANLPDGQPFGYTLLNGTLPKFNGLTLDGLGNLYASTSGSLYSIDISGGTATSTLLSSTGLSNIRDLSSDLFATMLPHDRCFDFENGPGSGWSSNVTSPVTTEIAPNGQTILGRFGAETVTLDVAAPSHNFASVEFDLHVIGPWSGNAGDFWSVSADGNLLLNTTFSNNATHLQHYPDVTPPGDTTGATNSFIVADALDQLGYPPFVPDNLVGDATYSMDFAFAHTASQLALDFEAQLESVQGTGETWALDNLKVTMFNADIAPGEMPDFATMMPIAGDIGGPGYMPTDVDVDGDVEFRDLELVNRVRGPVSSPIGDPGDFDPDARVPGDGIAELKYDPNTGEVLLDTDGAVVSALSIYSTGVFQDANFNPIFGGDFLAASPFELGNLDSALVGTTGLVNLGAILPAGLTELQFEDSFVDALFVAAPGSGVQEFQFHFIPPMLPGDGNGDNFVGAADYTIWANNFGQLGAGIPGDYNFNNAVDAGDYTVWSNNFGMMGGGDGPQSAPEPSTLALAVLGLLGQLACGRSRSRRVRRLAIEQAIG